MARTATFALFDVLIGGTLEPQLRQWKRAGVSTPAIARLLEELTGRSVSDETVRRWLRELTDEAA